MSRIRDIANLFSTSTDAATDAEVAAAIVAHNNVTTSVHGISNTANLATLNSVASDISSHNTTANGHVKRGNTTSRPSPTSNGDVYMNTQLGYPEFYNGTTWIPIGAVPTAPSAVVATNQGSGRAYNNGKASVAFVAGTVPGSTYTITSNPGNYYNTGSVSPIEVEGLQLNTSYTFTATASSVYGTSAASSASNAITATTVPQAPSLSAVAGSQSAIITLTGANGGSSITSWSITSNPATATQTAASSPYTFTGLTDGTAYTFTATATNANGTSTASSASNSVTPMSMAMDPLQVVTVGAAGASSVSFTNIPATYNHLQIRGIARASNSGTVGNDNVAATFNSDNGSNYDFHYLYGNGSGTAISDKGINQTIMLTGKPANASATAGVFGSFVIDILDYANTNKYKTVRVLTGIDNNGSGVVFFNSNLWRNTNAINSMSFSSGTGYNQYSQFALYGIKVA